jgi:hypothetical protein
MPNGESSLKKPDVAPASTRGPVVTIHQPEFLPWLGLIDKLRQSDVVVILDSVQFRKNYFQNRNRIRTSDGFTWLTVPVLTKHRSGQTIHDVTIRDDQAWRRKHRESMLQSYRRATFLDEHLPALLAIYEAAGSSLVELNEAIIHWLAGAFGLSCQFVRSSSLDVGGRKTDLLFSICRELGASVYLSGPSGREYLEENRFTEAGVSVRYADFRHPVYRQCYEPFVPMMSAVDLLFTHGPQSSAILRSAADPEAPQPY